jgi:glycosyl hydrolase group 75 (putative chitosanase)
MKPTYKVDGLSGLLLDDIPSLFNHPQTYVIQESFKGKKFACRLPSGQLYFESKLALDDDGSPYHAQDRTGQSGTAVKWANGTNLDADLVNYFVLPGGFYPKYNIRKGDIGVVIFGVRMAFACFGDVGPSNSLGEGSIALHRALGHETIIGRDTASGGRLVNAGIDSGVITIVFPASGYGFGRTNAESERLGRPLFEQLRQEAAAYSTATAAIVKKVGDRFIPSILRRP